MEKEILINLDELKQLEVECHSCHARMIFNVTSPDAKFPHDCPVCHKGWIAPNASGDPFVRFRGFIETLSRHHAKFRIQTELNRSANAVGMEEHT